MRCVVHRFEPWEGGEFRISLTYDAPDAPGRSTTHRDTYRGRFVELVPNERIVETMAFETDDPALQGEMTLTTTLADSGGGTEVVLRHDGVPDVVPRDANELGTRLALANLAELLEPA
jgi:uncharacterized protein YndB with AHSA1/START domain